MTSKEKIANMEEKLILIETLKKLEWWPITNYGKVVINIQANKIVNSESTTSHK